ncbi:MAG: CrcB family protein [Rhodoluna sp.]|nr:CrcB family protein [Rhodoluna sp.]
MPKALKVAALAFLGGALGSGLRYLIGIELEVAPTLFIVNSLGALLLGVANGRQWPSWFQPFFGTGVAGGFTTMSGLSLLINANFSSSPLNITGIVALMFAAGFAAYWLGLRVARLAK